MSHYWERHVALLNESCHPSLLQEACRTSGWGMLHFWMSRVTHYFAPIHEAHRTYEWVMSHVWMSQVTPVQRHDTRQSSTRGNSRDSFWCHGTPLSCVTWHIHVYIKMHSYV